MCTCLISIGGLRGSNATAVDVGRLAVGAAVGVVAGGAGVVGVAVGVVAGGAVAAAAVLAFRPRPRVCEGDVEEDEEDEERCRRRRRG